MAWTFFLWQFETNISIVFCDIQSYLYSFSFRILPSFMLWCMCMHTIFYRPNHQIFHWPPPSFQNMALFDEISGALRWILSVKCVKRSQVRTWKIRKFMKGALFNSNSHQTFHYIGAILEFHSNFPPYFDISTVFLIKIAGKQVICQCGVDTGELLPSYGAHKTLPWWPTLSVSEWFR